MRRFSLTSVWAMSLAACAPALVEPLEESDASVEPTDSAVITTDNDDGTWTSLVLALSSEEWIYFTFADGGREVLVEDHETSLEWDLRASRFNVRVNGGISGPGTVGAHCVDNLSFDSIRRAPAGEYYADAPDGNGDEIPDLAFRRPNAKSRDGWFHYDPRFHTVTPADVSYVVRAMSGDYYKLEFLSFYDDNGEGGYLRFRWAPVPAP